MGGDPFSASTATYRAPVASRLCVSSQSEPRTAAEWPKITIAGGSLEPETLSEQTAGLRHRSGGSLTGRRQGTVPEVLESH